MAGLRATIHNRDLPNLKQDFYTLERNTELKKVADIKKKEPFLTRWPTYCVRTAEGGNLNILI
jgi:hypothetical protein